MMQSLLDLPIAVKVALAPMIVGLCLVVTSASAYLTNLRTAGALGQVVHDNMPRLEQTERVKDRLLTTYATLMQSVAYEGAELKPELIAAVDSRLKANFKALHDDLDRLRAAAASRPDMAKRLEQVDQGLQRLERVAMQAIDLKGVGLGAAAVSITSSDEAFQALRQLIDEVAALEAQASQEQGALAEEAVAFGNRVSLGMTLIALLLSAAVTWSLVRLITTPLADAVKIAQEVASGNLAVQAQPVGRDATGQVLAALTEVSRRLSHTISGIRASVDEIDTASREIAQGNLDLSTRTERSSMSLQQAASTIEQLSATMRSNAEAALGAREQACQALAVAREGGGVVQGVVQTMDVINDQARRIREIIGVIDGIAFQTNILALNAAVEAARAGEQGRGFAVVAQEVRSLAGRSGAAAKEIRSLIGASVGQIEAGHQQARSAGETMQRIVGSIEQVSRQAVDIAEASAEQAQGIAHVNQTVSEMDRSTQQNAALVEQAAAATASLKQQAEGLMRAVAVFRTAA